MAQAECEIFQTKISKMFMLKAKKKDQYRGKFKKQPLPNCKINDFHIKEFFFPSLLTATPSPPHL